MTSCFPFFLNPIHNKLSIQRLASRSYICYDWSRKRSDYHSSTPTQIHQRRTSTKFMEIHRTQKGVRDIFWIELDYSCKASSRASSLIWISFSSFTWSCDSFIVLWKVASGDLFLIILKRHICNVIENLLQWDVNSVHVTLLTLELSFHHSQTKSSKSLSLPKFSYSY